MQTKVKICGITRVQDGIDAAQAGADFIGLVFYSGSPRCIDLKTAKAIVGQLPATTAPVGLFVNPTVAEVKQVLQAVPLAYLQFHGEETDSFCRQFGLPYWKAIRVRNAADIRQAVLDYPGAQALLLDTYHAGQRGGTGQVFDWSLIPQALDKPIVLAGGLHADNVADAVARVQPYAVDVSSGVERQPGIKSKQQMIAFCRNAKPKRP